LVGAGLFLNRGNIRGFISDVRKPDLPEAVDYSDVVVNDASVERSNPVNDAQSSNDVIAASPPEAAPRNDSQTVPASYNLAVPFQSQAPHSDWGLPYQEACEEASLIMADRFFSGESLSADHMDEAIKKLVAWEQDEFGYYEDTTAAEVVVMAREYFGLKALLDYDVTADTIKHYIAQNKLVIIPAAGRVLPNPNFTGEGPLYHMLVVRGYTPTHFITNDPGTRNGKEFVYTYDALINAVHDWPQEHGGNSSGVSEEDMLTGQKVMIVVDK